MCRKSSMPIKFGLSLCKRRVNNMQIKYEQVAASYFKTLQINLLNTITKYSLTIFKFTKPVLAVNHIQ